LVVKDSYEYAKAKLDTRVTHCKGHESAYYTNLEKAWCGAGSNPTALCYATMAYFSARLDGD